MLQFLENLLNQRFRKSVFLFAKLLGYNYLVVGCAGFILATAVNYFLSIRFVFRSGARFSKKN